MADRPITLRDRIRTHLWIWRWRIEQRAPWLYAAWRYLCGARRPFMGENTNGLYDAPGAWVSFGGACPVQGTGEVDGCGVYYRSRGESWSVEFYDCEVSDDLPEDDHLIWEYRRREYVGFAGGWIDHRESRRNLGIAIRAFRAWGLRHG